MKEEDVSSLLSPVTKLAETCAAFEKEKKIESKAFRLFCLSVYEAKRAWDVMAEEDRIAFMQGAMENMMSFVTKVPFLGSGIKRMLGGLQAMAMTPDVEPDDKKSLPGDVKP